MGDGLTMLEAGVTENRATTSSFGPFLVFTDLDGTLLDHDTYSWREAQPALRALEDQHCPVLFNSSKTVAEMRQLRTDMANRHPFVAENGAVIAIPEGYPTSSEDRLETHFLGADRPQILECLQQFRHKTGAQFLGFNDMTLDDIVHHTGLTTEEAEQASLRQATEPLIWQDSIETLEEFDAWLSSQGLRTLRGGRFIHVMGQCDKAGALNYLVQRYRQDWASPSSLSVALGDSQNDQQMLNAADIAIIMGAADNPPFIAEGQQKTLYAGGKGPLHWGKALTHVLNAR